MEDKTRITPTDPVMAEEISVTLPDELKEDVTTVIDTYGDLDHNDTLKTVYEKYPVYIRMSRLHRRKQYNSKGTGSDLLKVS